MLCPSAMSSGTVLRDHHRHKWEKSFCEKQCCCYGLPGQYAYAGYMPNKPSYIAKAIPAQGSAEEKVRWLLPRRCEGWKASWFVCGQGSDALFACWNHQGRNCLQAIASR